MAYGSGGGIEQELLQHYNIPHLYPQEWPSAKDNEGDGEVEKPSAADAKAKHLRRYTQLEKGPRTTMMFRGRGTPSMGPDMPVPPKDEPDALGASASTLAMLRQKRAPIDVDPEYRNKFFLSSPQFSPNTYLHQLHNTASKTELDRGLKYLENSIEAKSGTLKELVESNFERFVRAKAIVDSVYTEMRNHGDTGQRMSRQGFGHGRKISNQAAEKRKNALAEESDYGTIGMRRPLVEATTKAQEIWGPALGGREREDHLKLVLSSIEQNRVFFDTGSSIEDCIKRRDYAALTEEYAKAERFGREAQSLAQSLASTDQRMTDRQMQQILITGRVLLDVKVRIEEFKRDTWHRLTTVNVASTNEVVDGKQEEYMELISILLQLGIEQNPIIAWLNGRHEYLLKRVKDNFDRVRRDLEVMRRRLAASPRPSAKVLATHLMNATKPDEPPQGDTDTQQVLRFWEKQTASLSSLLLKGGLFSEVEEFWKTANDFVNGARQRHLPQGIDGRSRAHHRLGNDVVKQVQANALGLFSLMREQLHALFVEDPLEEIEELFSPTSPVAKTPVAGLMSPSKAARFTFNPDDVPPPIAHTTASASWEKYAFWPPHGNSLSAVTSLAKIINIVASGASHIVAVEVVRNDPALVQRFQLLVSDIRERFLAAVCTSWTADSENCRELEDWTRSSDNMGITKMPARFFAYEVAMINHLQRIVFLPSVQPVGDGKSVVQVPSQRNKDAVARAFKNSLYKAFAGMMEHAAKPMTGIVSADDSPDGLELTIPVIRDQNANQLDNTIDSTSNNARKLLTISNFQHLKEHAVQGLCKSFQESFPISLEEDERTAREVLKQMDSRVFQSYIRPTCDNLRQLITTGITSPTYASSDPNFRPVDAKTYVYDVLLALVLVHTEVSRTTPQLLGSVLSTMLEQLSAMLIEAFEKRPRYTLTALMQATLDVEFLSQTLDQYTTKKASEIQNQIYGALDNKTDNEARHRLQSGLPEMKALLKKLRGKTAGEFGCFKRPRKAKREGASQGGERGSREPGAAY